MLGRLIVWVDDRLIGYRTRQLAPLVHHYTKVWYTSGASI